MMLQQAFQFIIPSRVSDDGVPCTDFDGLRKQYTAFNESKKTIPQALKTLVRTMVEDEKVKLAFLELCGSLKNQTPNREKKPKCES